MIKFKVYSTIRTNKIQNRCKEAARQLARYSERLQTKGGDYFVAVSSAHLFLRHSSQNASSSRTTASSNRSIRPQGYNESSHHAPSSRSPEADSTNTAELPSQPESTLGHSNYSITKNTRISVCAKTENQDSLNTKSTILKCASNNQLLQSRGGRVDNAQALRACGSSGPRGFESLPRRQNISRRTQRAYERQVG